MIIGLCETRFAERHISIPEKYSILGAKNVNSLSENCSKCTKMAVAVGYVKFSKIFQRSMPPDPLEPFCSSTCFKLFLPENTTLEKISKFGAPSSKKFVITPQT